MFTVTIEVADAPTDHGYVAVAKHWPDDGGPIRREYGIAKTPRLAAQDALRDIMTRAHLDPDGIENE